MMYLVIAIMSATWMWLRMSGMIALSNLIAMALIAVISWKLACEVFKGGESNE